MCSEYIPVRSPYTCVCARMYVHYNIIYSIFSDDTTSAPVLHIISSAPVKYSILSRLLWYTLLYTFECVYCLFYRCV